MKIEIKETLKKYRRVLMIARKPEKEELKISIRICGLGLIIKGLLGFFFYLISVIVSLLGGFI